MLFDGQLVNLTAERTMSSGSVVCDKIMHFWPVKCRQWFESASGKKAQMWLVALASGELKKITLAQLSWKGGGMQWKRLKPFLYQAVNMFVFAPKLEALSIFIYSLWSRNKLLRNVLTYWLSSIALPVHWPDLPGLPLQNRLWPGEDSPSLPVDWVPENIKWQ